MGVLCFYYYYYYYYYYYCYYLYRLVTTPAPTRWAQQSPKG
jgi:hypothetical protein